MVMAGVAPPRADQEPRPELHGTAERRCVQPRTLQTPRGSAPTKTKRSLGWYGRAAPTTGFVEGCATRLMHKNFTSCISICKYSLYDKYRLTFSAAGETTATLGGRCPKRLATARRMMK